MNKHSLAADSFAKRAYDLMCSPHFLLLVLAVLMVAAFPMDAAAQSIDQAFRPVINTICSVYRFMQGTLALVVFGLTVIVLLLVGMFTKVDWAKLLAVGIVMGLIIGLPSGISVFAGGAVCA
jgi:type IV secretory pathway VirB2 component (pilin)